MDDLNRKTKDHDDRGFRILEKEGYYYLKMTREFRQHSEDQINIYFAQYNKTYWDGNIIH
jgi:hypothetical protein